MAREQRRYSIDDKMDEVYTGAGRGRSLDLPKGLEFFKPPESGSFQIDVIAFEVKDTVNRFLPELRFSSPGNWHWNVIYYVHYGVGPNNEKMTCSASTFYGKACAVCEEATRLKKSPHKEDFKAAQAIKAKERQLLLVKERDPRSGRSGPIQLWDVSTWNFFKQLKAFNDRSNPKNFEKYQRFWRFERGLTLSVYASQEPTGDGGGKYTKFSVTGFEERDEPLPEETWDHGYDLYGMVLETAYATGKQMFHGITDEDDDAWDRPAPSRSGRDDRPQEPDAPPARRSGVGRDQPPKAQRYVPQEGESVRLKKKDDDGNYVVGLVTRVDEGKAIAHVKVDGRQRPLFCEYDEIEPVPEGDDSWMDKKGEAPAQDKPRSDKAERTTGRGKWDDRPTDDDDDRMYGRGGHG